LYVTRPAFRGILRGEFGLVELPDEDGLFARCVQLFNERLAEFVRAIAPANLWILHCLDADRRESVCTALNLPSWRIGQWITIGLDVVTANYSLNDVIAATDGTRTMSQSDLDSGLQKVDWERAQADFRGKFQAHFLRVFLDLLGEEARSATSGLFPVRRTVGLRVSEKNFLSDLCQYAETPGCLRSFLSSLMNDT
jgi:hypothetical protein